MSTRLELLTKKRNQIYREFQSGVRHAANRWDRITEEEQQQVILDLIDTKSWVEQFDLEIRALTLPPEPSETHYSQNLGL